MTTRAISSKLRREMDKDRAEAAAHVPVVASVQAPLLAPGETVVKLKRIKAANDWLILIQIPIESVILNVGSDYKNEGIVVGAGPGLPGASGTRCPSQFEFGNVIAFAEHSVVLGIDPKSGIYAGRHLIVISERNAIMQLPDIPFEEVTD